MKKKDDILLLLVLNLFATLAVLTLTTTTIDHIVLVKHQLAK